MLQQYRNSSGTSGIQAFEIGEDFIVVQFKKKGTYLYTYKTPGSYHVERMKTLAMRGRGLNTYINTYVRNRYESKT